VKKDNKKSIDEIVSSAIKKQSSRLINTNNCEIEELSREYKTTNEGYFAVVTAIVKPKDEVVEDYSKYPKFNFNIKLNGLSGDENGLSSLSK
jgi:hypothetical protein